MPQQRFYHTDDEASFDSQTKRDAVSITQTIPSDCQQELLDRSLSCMNNGADLEVKGRGPMRRRIQVACMRCRKRKIKCSGDIGDGQGSHSAGSGWPYPPSDMVSQRSGIYAPSVACKVGTLSAKTSSHRISPFLRASDHEVASDSPNSYGRQSFGIDPTINYEDESTTPYSVPPSSAYMLPSSPQMLMSDYSVLGWGSRNWGTNLQGGRAHGETMVSEAEPDNSLVHPAYSYVISGQVGQAAEALGMVTTPASLASPAQGPERTLPNPASRYTHRGNNNGFTANSDDLSGLSATRDYKLGSRWRSEIRSPMQPVCNVSLGTAMEKRLKLVPSCIQDTSLGTLPGASSNASCPMVQPSGAFANSEATGSATESNEGFRGALDSRLRSCSLEHNRRAMSPSHYRTDYYGYTRPAYRTRLTGGASAESTLITGIPMDGISILHFVAWHAI
ncbi:hypothetical protein BJY01DRAFT_240503 [Aspergillus pseudoustus]|uniref:Zn(2)-C6 fungal-type domain-containing protein n=1 Tax=Aspergillus pseudoustus TaxID=1810923 RepID=A0ABR4ITA2_9EURO